MQGKGDDCTHDDWITYGQTLQEDENGKAIKITCEDCKLTGIAYEDNNDMLLNEVWNEQE